MLAWIVENASTLVVSAVLLGVLTAVAVYLWRRRKKGGCGCGCDQCAMSEHCRGRDEK